MKCFMTPPWLAGMLGELIMRHPPPTVSQLSQRLEVTASPAVAHFSPSNVTPDTATVRERSRVRSPPPLGSVRGAVVSLSTDDVVISPDVSPSVTRGHAEDMRSGLGGILSSRQALVGEIYEPEFCGWPSE